MSNLPHIGRDLIALNSHDDVANLRVRGSDSNRHFTIAGFISTNEVTSTDEILLRDSSAQTSSHVRTCALLRGQSGLPATPTDDEKASH